MRERQSVLLGFSWLPNFARRRSAVSGGVLFALVAWTALACGGGESAAPREESGGGYGLSSPGLFSQSAAPRQPAPAEKPVERTVVVEKERAVREALAAVAPTATAAPRAAATPAPAQPGARPEDGFRSLRGLDLAGELDKIGQLQATQERIIVRTVDLEASVRDVGKAVDDVAFTAKRFGGWVVSTDRSQKHRGFIAVRVPADKLDQALEEIRGYAVDVEAEVSTSRDVTDEFVDLSSRLRNLQATEQALLRLFERAVTVEEALKVQQELTQIQGQIEQIEGRISFIEQTSAFSLVNVTVRLEPIEMKVDAGKDRTISIHQPARFTANLEPPEGIDEFVVSWDFGDGGSPVVTNRTAPTQEEGVRVTSSVIHIFSDETGSPFIVQVKITGTGKGGTAEGEDTMLATVSRLPVIDVFAGSDRTVREREEVEFRASLTRPEGIDDLKYEWDFGDGSTKVAGELETGTTEVVATHAFEHHRPQTYSVVLKLTGTSVAGNVEASDAVEVFVVESPEWRGGRWDFNDTARGATRAITQTADVGVRALIWLGIFSPLVAIGGITAYALARKTRWGGNRR